MNRPLRGPQNPTPVDHATDTYDTIDWLVKNVPETNGKVGILGISYDGFLPLMALVEPAPGAQGLGADEPDGRRLDGRRLVPQRRVPPARDVAYIYDQEATRKSDDASGGRATSTTTTCSCEAGSAGELGRRRGLEQLGFWRKILEHPSLRRLLARPGGGQDPRGAAAEGARDARPQPLGPGGHLRRARRLQGDRAEGHGQRQGVPGDGSVASRPGDRGRQRARRDQVRQRHRALLPPRRSCARSSTSTSRTARRRRTSRRSRRSRPARTRGGGCPRGRPAARAGCTSEPTPLYLGAGLEAELRPRRRPATRRSTNTSPIPRSPCRSARGRSSRRATTRARAGAMARRRPARGVRPAGRRSRSSPTS